MRLNLRVFARQLNRLPGTGDGIDGRAQNVPLTVLIDLAVALLQLDQLRLVLKGIQQHDTAIVRQTQTGCDVRRLGLIRTAFGRQLFVQIYRLRGRSTRSTVFLVFVRCLPIHQGFRHFLPLVTFRAQVAHPIALHFPLAGKLVRAVLQDETFGELLSVGAGDEPCGEDKDGCEQTFHKTIIHPRRRALQL